MSYGVKAFPTDHYDRKCEAVKSFRNIEDMWKWVLEFLSVGNRKVIIYERSPPRRWRGMRRTTIRKIAELTKPCEVPEYFRRQP